MVGEDKKCKLENEGCQNRYPSFLVLQNLLKYPINTGFALQKYAHFEESSG